MAQEPKQEPVHKFQGLVVSGDDVIIDSHAEETGTPPLKKLSEQKSADQLLKQLEDEFPDDETVTKTGG